MLSTYITI